MNTFFLKKIDRYLGSFLAKILPAPRDFKGKFSLFPRFLFIRPGGIGDAVLLCPSILRIKSLFPSCQIYVLAESRNSAIFNLCRGVDEVFRYDRYREFISCLRNSYDVVIDTEQWHRLSAVFARLISAKFRVGFATNDRCKFFNQQVQYLHDNYEAESFLDLLGFLDLQTRSFPASYLVIPQETQGIISSLIPNGLAPFVVIFPGASIAERKWGSDKFKMLASRLIDSGFGVVVVGGRVDQELGEIIAKGTVALNLTGKTSLIETAAIVEKASLLISGDSGILHIGVGLGKPTVSLFGPGIAKKWAPRGPEHRVINKNLQCSPCTQFGYTPECSMQARCISEISVDEVFEAALSLLN